MTFVLRLILISFIFLSTITMTNATYARTRDALKCLEFTRRIENQYNIPPHLLSAIAITESGRNRREFSQKIHVPWPWTANVQGKGYYFNSKKEALSKFKSLLAENNDMFDIGCMQINWHYHRSAFSSLEEAINPYYNVKYAAEFLRSLYKRTGSWPKAVERYHSGNAKYYRRYRKIVAKNWISARNLMSPIDGKISHLFATGAVKKKPKKKSVISKEQKRREQQRLERMREVAKLRARIRDYANTNYE